MGQLFACRFSPGPFISHISILPAEIPMGNWFFRPPAPTLDRAARRRPVATKWAPAARWSIRSSVASQRRSIQKRTLLTNYVLLANGKLTQRGLKKNLVGLW